ncbi:unnamed protein product [Agarophyton chilense]
MRRPVAFARCAQLFTARSSAPRARFAACARLPPKRPVVMPNVIDVLQKRGLLDACTAESYVVKTLCEKPITVYTGFDPTADSLHLGNLLAILTLAWFQRCGHRVVALLGGATARVGDPSGKSVERPVLDDETIRRNLNGIEANLNQILQRSERHLQQAGMANQPFVIANNYDWLGQISFLHFLRDVGKYARVNTMIAKDSVKTRLASDDGISFTEFTYQLLQAFDFVHLSDSLNCVMQLGGSDQWGNITAGTELARKIRSKILHGITFPLLTTADGKKFGKSENGAVWLSKEKLSPYQFYQFLIRTTDEDVITLLKRLTFLALEEIENIEQQMKFPHYVPNTAQKRLAEEVTRIVHGDEGVKSALAATAAAAPGSSAVLSVEALEAIASDMPSASFGAEEIVGIGVVDLMVKGGLQKSKGEARRLIRNGGGYLNNEKITDERAVLESNDLVGGKLALLAAGKKNKLLVRVK